MCRIFGFRSVLNSQVNRSLISAENALMLQSNQHPDGWGVAYFVSGSPHLIKSVDSAIEDKLFKRVSGIVASQTVIAHLRKATQGENTILNTHPFQFGRWVFAHNGNIKGFKEHRETLRKKVAPKLRNYILGDTDSELFFYLLLSHLERRTELHRPHCELDDILKACKATVNEIIGIVGEYSEADDAEPTSTFLTFVLTDGNAMVGFQGGKNLHYSTHKTRCSERDSCPYLDQSCESAASDGDQVNHLIFSSGPLQGENVWNLMKPGALIGIDWRMKITLDSLDHP